MPSLHGYLEIQILNRVDRMTVLDGRKKPPLLQCFQKQAIEAGVLGGMQQFHGDGAVLADMETYQGCLFQGRGAQFVRNDREWMNQGTGCPDFAGPLSMGACGRGRIG